MSRPRGRSRKNSTDRTPNGNVRRRLYAVVVIIAIAAIAVAVVFYPRGTHSSKEDNVSGERGNQNLSATSSGLSDEVRLPFGTPDQWKQLDDPLADGWDTEDIAAKCGDQFKKFAELLNDPAKLNDQQVSSLVDEEFQCGPLVPQERQETYRDEVFEVYQWEESNAASTQEQNSIFKGRKGFKQALGQLKESHGGDGIRLAVKIIRVEPAEDAVSTRQIIELESRASELCVEQHATWLAEWTLPSVGQEPKLRSLKVIDWKQSTTREASLLADCTESVLGRNSCFREQFLVGMNHWFERIQDTRYNALFSTPGLAVADVNGDGLDDLYVCQEAGLPNRLFVQQSDGTAVDAAAQWGVDWLDACRSALLLDLDNDGDQDLAVATVGHLIVASNEGHAFTIRTCLATDEDTMSIAAADYDSDGKLDIFVCVNNANALSEKPRRASVAGVASTVYYDSTTGGRNSLFRNEITAGGDWRFRDVTQECGLDADNRRVSYAATWEDYDNDGDQDLYVANDFGPNNLWRNDRSPDGKINFTDVAGESGAEDRASGMSAAWGDINRDGAMDLYVGNMFSSAGERITHQPEFKAGNQAVKSSIQRFARGNTLLQNGGNGLFDDISETANVTVGRWSWSSNFLDLNNDGWEDIVVANGYITTEDSGDL